MRTAVLMVLVIFAGCVSTGSTIDKSKMSEGYYTKGLSYLQEKNLELASVEFNRSIQTDSTNKLPYYGLGIISDYQGKLEDARKYYEQALDRDPNFSEAYNALGVVYFKQQKWKEAIKAFNKALANKLYTTPHIPLINLGDLYMAQKDYTKAIEAYSESIQYANLDFTIQKLGTALFEAGRIKEAISEFQKGVTIAPQNASMRFSLAVAFLKDGNKRSALSEFKKVTDLDPKSDIAHKAKDYIRTLR
jgi:type IV pilus assembly protein PilF